MNMFTPAEMAENYVAMGAKKASSPIWKLLILGIAAGFIIGMGSAVSNTATHAIENVSVAKTISGLIFPFGLGMVMLMGVELFTGNTMIFISALEKKATWSGVFKNWFGVYLGNMIGAGLLAAALAFFGQLNYSNGYLAVYTIKIAAAKSTIPFTTGIVMGILCNLLVCMGVFCSISAKDTAGKILGAYIPVVFFVICGFEHCVANMYYIPAGIFANSVPEYAKLASDAMVNTSSLTWGNFFLTNLVPVTIGNIIGGAAIALMMWACYVNKSKAA